MWGWSKNPQEHSIIYCGLHAILLWKNNIPKQAAKGCNNNNTLFSMDTVHLGLGEASDMEVDARIWSRDVSERRNVFHWVKHKNRLGSLLHLCYATSNLFTDQICEHSDSCLFRGLKTMDMRCSVWNAEQDSLLNVHMWLVKPLSLSEIQPTTQQGKTTWL